MSSLEWNRLWEEHTKREFATRDTETTLETVVEDAYVNHIPTMIGGYGKRALHVFSSRDLVPGMPPDTALAPVSRTAGERLLVDEMNYSLTHAQEMPWMLPRARRTHKGVEAPLIDRSLPVRGGKIACREIEANTPALFQ